jgi:uncharacterized membrane protein
MEILQTKLVRAFSGYWSFIVAALLAAFYLATTLYIASHLLLWFDEITTVLIARMPDCKTLWHVVSRQCADSVPPGYHLVVRIFDKLFGHTDVAVRLPSALGMTVGLLVTFDCARRLTDGVHGLMALSLLACSYLPRYGYEARPYGLIFMLAALSLWVWVHTRDDRVSWAACFGALTFLSVAMHYYAVLCFVPYGLWEMCKWKPWRPPSRKMIAALLAVLIAAAVFSTHIQAEARGFRSGPARSPSLYSLALSLPNLFLGGWFLLGLIMVWVALVGRQARRNPLQPMQTGEAVGWLFLFVPLAGYVLGQATHLLMLRYLIGTLPGVAVAFSCWLWRHFREARRVSVGILLLLTIQGLGRQVLVTRHPERNRPGPPTRHVLNLEGALRNDGKQFIVLCDHMLYAEVHFYSKHPERYAMLLVVDHDQIANLERIFGQYHPMPLWRLDDLKQHAREAALLEPPSTGQYGQFHSGFLNTLEALKQAGFRTRIRSAGPPEIVYLE